MRNTLSRASEGVEFLFYSNLTDQKISLLFIRPLSAETFIMLSEMFNHWHCCLQQLIISSFSICWDQHPGAGGGVFLCPVTLPRSSRLPGPFFKFQCVKIKVLTALI